MARNARILSLAFPLLTAVLLAGCDREKQDAAQALLDAFGRQCRSQGEWTSAALAHTQALATVVRSLQSRDACRGVDAVLSNTQTLLAEIGRLQASASQNTVRL